MPRDKILLKNTMPGIICKNSFQAWHFDPYLPLTAGILIRGILTHGILTPGIFTPGILTMAF